MNKPMFWIGIALIAITAGMLLFVEEDLGMLPYILLLIGIFFIGASKYRPMKKKK
jgi:hypothetical protein